MERESYKVGNEADLLPTLPIIIEINGERVYVDKRGDLWVAFNMRCPHKGGKMKLTDIEGNLLACPLHGWVFDLDEQGEETHGYIGLTEYEITEKDDEIWIRM